MPNSLLRIRVPVLLALTACHPSGADYPWKPEAAARSTRESADVRTLNQGYARTSSHVLVREVERPTRAALDYAAYHANFMIAEEEPEGLPATASKPQTDHPFADLIARDTLTPDFEKTPLSADERSHPLAFAPLSEYLLARKVQGAEALAELGSAVRSESWGQPTIPGVSSQAISEMYLHREPSGHDELWVKIEFAPWFKALGPLPDQDRDGYPEVYGRARADRLTPEVVDVIEHDYAGRVLNAAEVKGWANQLSSYWYPSFNTDLVPPGASWPDEHTEADIKRELAGLQVNAPTIVLRGKPQGKPTYEVFEVKGLQAAADGGESGDALVLAKTRPTPEPERARDAVRAELAKHGNSFEAWNARLAPFHAAVQNRLKASTKAQKGFAGADGFLFYRNSMEFVVGGDLEKQPKGKNPVPIIVAWKRELEKLGVDFLFVPVPSKEEIFPDELEPKFKELAGEVVVPYERKFVDSLAAQGVEVFDLHEAFLRARKQTGPSDEPLYQHQDTHWTARGLELAAQLLSERIKQYPWYAELARHAQKFSTRDTTFTRFGDLHSRLPEALKKHYKPETLPAHQVLRADGTPYDDDPDSPIVLLGDSFTGVYELTDAEHAGLSAHIARGVSYPLDLVMSYGGGPNVRNKLMRRGEQALAQKKLVIWAMADRDLYNYWEDWEPIKTP